MNFGKQQSSAYNKITVLNSCFIIFLSPSSFLSLTLSPSFPSFSPSPSYTIIKHSHNCDGKPLYICVSQVQNWDANQILKYNLVIKTVKLSRSQICLHIRISWRKRFLDSALGLDSADRMQFSSFWPFYPYDNVLFRIIPSSMKCILKKKPTFSKRVC